MSYYAVGPAATATLGIDPVVLVYCGYIGPSGAHNIAVDAAGNAYLTGETTSDQTAFPVRVGPDLTFNGGVGDAFVVKVRADGTGLVYAGYIGGDDYDVGRGIAVDAAGSAYVTGGTSSDQNTFPVTVGPGLTLNNGPGSPYSDAFVAKVKADGTGLVYAGYIGSYYAEGGIDIAVDAAGNAYVAGGYSDLSRTAALVWRIKADGTGLDYTSGIGGAGYEAFLGIAVDAAGNAYVTGETTSDETSLPVTVGPDLSFNGSAYDAFVAKLRPDGRDLDYLGYIGGAENEYGAGIAVDTGGNAYVAGTTSSSESTFPVTVGPDLTFNGAVGDVDTFVAKVKADGTTLVYAGYIGGVDDEIGIDVAVDTAGNAYVTGMTYSNEATFPVTLGPDLTFNGLPGDIDAFVAQVKADGTRLLYAGYIGGANPETAAGIAVDAAGSAYVYGDTGSEESSFPVIVGPDLTFNARIASTTNDFVAKVSPGPSCPAAAAAVADLRAVKQTAIRDNIDLSFSKDPVASGYNIWYVTRKADIDLARQKSQPPARGVAACSAPAPAPGNSCTDFGAVSRGAPTLFFYQVRAACDAASEGP